MAEESISRREALKKFGVTAGTAAMTGCMGNSGKPENVSSESGEGSQEDISIDIPESGIFEYEDIRTGGSNGRELIPVPFLALRRDVGDAVNYDGRTYTGEANEYNVENSPALVDEAILLENRPKDLEDLSFGNIFEQLKNRNENFVEEELIEYQTAFTDAEYVPNLGTLHTERELNNTGKVLITSVHINDYKGIEDENLLVVAEDEDIPSYNTEEGSFADYDQLLNQYQKTGELKSDGEVDQEILDQLE